MPNKHREPRNFSFRGFLIGVAIGLIGWLYYHNLIPFVEAWAFGQIIVVICYAFANIITLGITIFCVKNKKAAFGTFLDGLFVGTVTSFDIMYIVMQIYLGHFPFSIDVIFL
jgi:hypothetical protein